MKVKFLHIVLFLFASTTLVAQILDGDSIEKTGTTTSTSFVTLNDGVNAEVTVDVTSVNKVMVIATFNCKNSGAAVGSFRTADSANLTDCSGTIERTLDTHFGVGSVVHIYDVSALSGNRTYVFQHATTAGTSTTAVQLTAIALYDGTNQLASEVKVLASPVSLTSSWAPVVETDVVISPNTGGFYVSASIQSGKNSGSENTIGEWVIQYKKTVTGTWEDLSYTILRSTSGTGKGIINLAGALPDSMVAGDYYFRVAHRKTSGTDNVETQACNIVAVALSAGGGFFPVTVSSKPSIKTTSTNISTVVETTIKPLASTSLFLHAQYGMNSNKTADAPIYDLYMKEAGVEFYNGSDFYRYLKDKNDDGSAASSGLVTGLTNGLDYNISLRHATVSKVSLTTVDSYLIGFGLTKAASFKVPITVNATQGLISSSYNTLKEAFDDINLGVFRGNIEILVNDNITETVKCVLNASGDGNANYTSIQMYPTAPNLTIDGNLADKLITLKGVDNLTIDGRVNLIGSNTDFTISNTSTSTSARTIYIEGEATYNTIRYCNIKGSQTSLNRGVIEFGRSKGGGSKLGNSNNTIEYCKLTYAGATASSAPATMIYSKGSKGKPNRNNTVRYNEFIDYLRPTSTSHGIFLDSDSREWTIEGNSFYHTSAFTVTGDYNYRVIYINNKTAGGFIVKDNFIGGTEAECGGTAWIKTGGNTLFEGILFKTSKTIVSNIYGNTIKNINWTNSGIGYWRGIHIIDGAVEIGTLGGNTIGATTGVESIVVTNGGSGGYLYGIRVRSKDEVNVSNNFVGAIKTNTTNTSHAFNLIGIGKTSVNGDITFSNNTIGSTVTPDSFEAGSTSTNNTQILVGINSDGKTTSTITENTITNITNSVTGTNSSRSYGIQTTQGSNTITKNTVSEISSASSQTGASAAAAAGAGIAQRSILAGATQIVKENTIRNIKSTQATANIEMYGIFFRASTTGVQEITENFIEGFTYATSNVASTFSGISLSNCKATCANNIINVGSVSLGYNILGIYDRGNTGYDNKLYFNTIYIGGSVSSGSSSLTAALWSNSNTSTRDYRNNIFENVRTGGTINSNYAIYLRGNTGLTIDYNDYLFPAGSILGEFFNTNAADLAAWKTVTGQDVNSLNTDPIFTNPGGTEDIDYITAAVLPGISGTGVTNDYDGLLRQATPQMGAFEINDYVWEGTTNTDFATASNWQNGVVPPDGSDLTFAATPLNDCYLDQARTIRHIINAQSTYKFVLNGNTLTFTGDFNLTNGAQVDASATASVLIIDGDEAQSLPAGTFVSNTIAGLTVNNVVGLSQNEDLTISEALTLTSGAFSIGANTLTLNGTVTILSGILTGGVTSNIVYGGNGATTGLPGITLNDLTINRANGVNLMGSVSVGGTLALTNGLLTLGTNTLTLSGSSPTRTSGTIDASNGSASLEFTNSSAIILPASIFSAAVNNFTITGIGGVTANSNFTINGILSLQAQNPISTKGLLDVGINTISMGASATTIGIGDVTGIVSRTSFVTDEFYTFGNEFTTISFASGGTYPTEIKCKITIGEPPTWKTEAIQREYDFVQTGGVDCTATVVLHYHEDELNGIFEQELTPYTHSPPSSTTEWGRSNYNLVDNWVEISNVPISEFPTAFDQLLATLGQWSGLNTFTWNGSVSTDWTVQDNWTPYGVPLSSSAVIIPDAIGTPVDPIFVTTAIDNLTIQPGGIADGGTSTQFTLNGSAGAWNNIGGTLNPATNTVIFTNASASVAGTTNFNNITINNGAALTSKLNSIVRIAGVVTKNGTGTWHTVTEGTTTVEYNGGAQTVVIPNTSTNRFYNLILSGTGAKTMPAQALDILGDFEVGGTASVTGVAPLNIEGYVLIDTDATFNTGAFDHVLKGNFENYGTFTAVTNKKITLLGTSTQNILGEAATTFTNLVVNNAADVNLFFDGNVNEALTLTSGNLIVSEATLGINGTVSKTAGKISVSEVSLLSFGGSSAFTVNSDLFTDVIPSIKALTINNSAGVTLGNQSMTVVDSLSLASGTFILAANTFTMSGTKITRTSGNINAGNASATMYFNAEEAVLVPASTFTGVINNLTIDGIGGVTSAGDFTVDGVLNLLAENPTESIGVLNMLDGATLKTLTMGGSATTIGLYDATGIVKRTSFIVDTPYTFGNQFTTMNFVTGGTLPTEISVKIIMGQAPSWKTEAILREYDIVRSGGAGTVILNLHYQDTELNSVVEDNLSVWNYISSTATDLGTSNADYTDNYIERDAIDISTLPVSFDLSLWSLAKSASIGDNLPADTVETSGTTSSTTFVTVTGASVGLNVASTTAVMVIATFNCKTSSGDAEGAYRISESGNEATNNSGVIERSLNINNGVGSVVYIFEDAGDKTFVFQHKTSDAGVPIETSVQFTAIGLSDGTNTLNHDVKTLASPLALTSSWVSVLETESVTLPNAGGFYVSASVQSAKISGVSNTVGEWIMQYKKSSTGAWTDLNSAVSRSTSGTNKGIISLVAALPDETLPDNYWFRVAHRLISGSDPVETQACKIVALALGTGGEFFPITIATKSTIPTTSTVLENAVEKAIIPQAGTDLFMHAQYGMQADAVSNAPVYDLNVYNATTEIYNGSDFERYLSGASDLGSAVSSGLATGLLVSETYQMYLRHAATTSTTLISSSLYLVGFGLTRAASFTLPINKWKGTTSTDWGTSSNWTGGFVPSANPNILFDDAPINHCILDQNRTVNDITNAQTTYRTVTNGFELTLLGDLIFSNSAQVDASVAASTIKYAGLAAQNIQVGEYLTNTIYNLTADNAVGVTQNDDIIVTNDLTINSGKKLTVAAAKELTVSGAISNSAGDTGLVLKSTVDGTASLIHNTTNVPATVERYISGAAEDWHFLSSPVSNQAIAGSSWVPSGTYGNGTGYDLYVWDEPTPCWAYQLNTDPSTVDNINWPEAHVIPNTTTEATNFISGRGYLYSVEAANPTSEFAGNLNNGTVSYPITANNSVDPLLTGFNLIGNPYPSAIDWKASSGWTRSNLVDSGGGYDMWIWNPAASNYGVFNSIGTTGTNSVTQYIASMQGFFVRTASNVNISMTNDIRVHTGASSWLKQSNNSSNVKVNIASNSGGGFDEVLLQFGASLNEIGALKLFSPNEFAPSAYLDFKSNELSTLYLTNIKENPEVLLMFKPGRDGEQTLKVELDLNHFKYLMLEDKKTKTSHNLIKNPTYKFNASVNDKSNRFVLHFSAKKTNNDELLSLIYYNGEEVVVDLSLVETTTEVKIVDILGRVIVNKTVEGNTIHYFPVSAKNLVLIVVAKSENMENRSKVFIY